MAEVPSQVRATRTARRSLAQLAAEAAGCTACDLYRDATQTVFGAGPQGAPMLVVGEQPGDIEDQAGEPFVGPAGRLFDEILEEAGIDRSDLYVTNAVKHFKWVARGKRRIHQKPNASEIVACHRWLDAELDVVQPRVVVALGATAARSVLGHPVTIREVRGKVLGELDRDVGVVVTIHPSAVLRADDADRRAMRTSLADDLRLAMDAARTTGRRTG